MIPEPIPPEARSDLDTAKTLTLVAMIFQAIFLVIGIIVMLFLLAAIFIALPTFGAAPVSSDITTYQAQQQLAVFALLPLLIFTGFGFIPVIFLLLTYFLIYKRLSEGRVEEALTPALVIGILSLILGGVISGILLIIAYVKANDAHNKILYARRTTGA